MKPDWLKADDGRDAGSVRRPHPSLCFDSMASFSMNCSIMIPSPDREVIYLDDDIYEILAPGTSVTRNDRESLLWRGLHVARRVSKASV